MVDVTAEIEADGTAAVKLQGGDEWELNIRAAPAGFAQLRDIGHVTPPGRSLQIGRCADAPVWWNQHDGQLYILIGHDDLTWDMAVIVPLATAEDIARAVARELQQDPGPD